jgi:hypothetical protein
MADNKLPIMRHADGWYRFHMPYFYPSGISHFSSSHKLSIIYGLPLKKHIHSDQPCMELWYDDEFVGLFWPDLLLRKVGSMWIRQSDLKRFRMAPTSSTCIFRVSSDDKHPWETFYSAQSFCKEFHQKPERWGHRYYIKYKPDGKNEIKWIRT